MGLFFINFILPSFSLLIHFPRKTTWFLTFRALMRFANLSEELNQLVEQWQSALGDRPKQQQNGLYQPFEVSNEYVEITFYRFGDNKIQHKLSL